MKRASQLIMVLVMLAATSGCFPASGGSMKVTALLADSAGLFVGNDVGILGVPVGKVTAIEPAGKSVRVTLTIKGDHAIPANAGAIVVARSVATDRYVEMTPVYHSGPKMQDGAVINEALTRTPVDFDQVLASLNELATGLAGSKASKDAIRRTIDVQSKLLDGKGELINRTVHSLSDMVNGVTTQRGNITGTLTALDTLTSKLAANQQTVRQFIQQVSKASQMLAAERNNFQLALRSMSQAVQVVAKFAEANRTQIVSLLNQSSDVMRTLMSKRTQLTEILEVFPVALQNLTKIVVDGKAQIRINPTDLLPLGGLLKSLCESLPLNLCESIGLDPLGLGTLLTGLSGGRP